MQRIIEWLAAPGAKGAVEDAAPTQQLVISPSESETKDGNAFPEIASVHSVTGYSGKAKDNLLDRMLDRLVKISGSEPIFLLILFGLLAWAFLGIPYGQDIGWAVMISDVQAIISYLFDSLLMRQQLNQYDELIRVSAMLRSRNASHQRMLREVLRGGDRYRRPSPADCQNLSRCEFTVHLPKETLVGRIATHTSNIMGHIVTVGLYWVCIVIWLGFGPHCGWSDRWQLYINSATSALMVLIFAFLANIQERHNNYIERCLDALFRVDSAIERRLRTLTSDAIPNPIIRIPGPQVCKLQRAIFYYADVVGTLIGIALLIIVMVVWVAIGPVMSFDSNWWLLIGTYAGLIGLNDGFVLRNVQDQLDRYGDEAFDSVNYDDLAILDDIKVPDPAPARAEETSISYRLSVKMGYVCAHRKTVVLGVVLIVGLIIGASAMKWTTTGQLLCNVPPSIIESFFMMILITGHNIAEERRRADLQNMYLRRLSLLAYVDKVTQVE